MSYYIGKDFSISYYEYDKIELAFLQMSNQIINEKPFKWHLFIHKIIQNRLITYFKDTTMIINLYALSKDYVEILFQIMKRYLDTMAITKIIYRQEFMIVHLYSSKVMEIFQLPYSWLAISYYYSLKRNNYSYPLYLGGVLNYHNQLRRIDLIIEIDKSFYFFSCNDLLPIFSEQCKTCLIYLYQTKNLLINDGKKLEYSYSHNERIKLINNLIT